MLNEKVNLEELQRSVLYGPVQSRRLGRSLGINILPLAKKLCNFNCVYCQYGPTTLPLDYREVPSVFAIQAVCARRFAELREAGMAPDCMTLSGNGEPTLHPEFPRVVRNLTALRDRVFPGVPLGILSDSSTVHREEIRRALERLDERYMKLDAGEPATAARVNQPLFKLDWERMIRNLARLRRVTLQSMFVTGAVDNTSSESVSRWIETVGRISPLSVQVYTVSRAPAHPKVLPVAIEKLEAIADSLIRRTGIPAHVFS